VLYQSTLRFITTNSAWPSLSGLAQRVPAKAGAQADAPRDALAPYPWSRSVNWCLAEG